MLYVRILLVTLLTIVSGYGDSRGFLHGAEIWKNGKLSGHHLVWSLIGFALGISAYIVALRFLSQIKQYSAELQTLGWFVVTIIGVALTSGSFLKWQRVDQLVSIIVAVGVLWLLLHTGA